MRGATRGTGIPVVLDSGANKVRTCWPESGSRRASVPGLIDFFPDALSLLAVAPEDVGIVLLQLIQQERGPRVALSNLEMPLWNAHTPAYPQHRRMEVG